MSAWRPALRIARRTVRRSIGRSCLVAALVAVPVAGATMVDVLVRTLDGGPARQAAEAMYGADGLISVTPVDELPASFSPSPYYRPDLGNFDVREPQSVDVAALLPAGSRLISAPVGLEVALDRDAGPVRATLIVADTTDPMLTDYVTLRDGALPAAHDEAVVSGVLARRLDLVADGALRADATVELEDGTGARVVGVADDPYCLSCELVVVLPGSPFGAQAEAEGDSMSFAGWFGAHDLLVDLPAGTDPDTVWPVLAREGVVLLPREAFLEPDRYPSPDEGMSSVDLVQTIALMTLVVGLGLLEVILLAGTAFAVGARRQVRDLGLVAVAGGSAKDVRRVVLAQGVVLGVLGAGIGVASGFALSIGLEPLWQRLSDQVVGPLRFNVVTIGIAASVGVASGLLAALIPALGASRMAPVDALMRRFRGDRVARRRTPILGLSLVGAGAAIAILGSRLMAGDFADYAARLETVQQTGAYLETPNLATPIMLVLFGMVVAIAGVVAVVPTLVGFAARSGRRLPISARLAFRDAGRHRHRTGPAATAIAVAVAGSIAVTIMLANMEAGQRLAHVPVAPPGVVVLDGLWRGEQDAATIGDDVRGNAAAVAARLPEASVHEVAYALAPDPNPNLIFWDLILNVRTVAAECVGECPGLNLDTGVQIAGPEVLAQALGRSPTGAELASLQSGTALVLVPGLVRDGSVEIYYWSGQREPTPFATIPAMFVERAQAYQGLPSVLISPDAAAALGVDVLTTKAVVVPGRIPTDDELDAAITAADDLSVGVFTDEGFDTTGFKIGRIVMMSVGAFVTLAGVAITVALSAAEGRADLATLAAVGAAPRRRRRLSASQALLVGGLGSLLGLALGTFTAYAIQATTGSPTFNVPFGNLAVAGLAVPLFAAAIAWALTPGRLPLVRRLD